MVFGSIVGKKLIIFLFNKMVIFLVKNGYFLAGYSFGGLYFGTCIFSSYIFGQNMVLFLVVILIELYFPHPSCRGVYRSFSKRLCFCWGLFTPGDSSFHVPEGRDVRPPCLSPRL